MTKPIYAANIIVSADGAVGATPLTNKQIVKIVKAPKKIKGGFEVTLQIINPSLIKETRS